MPLIQTPLEKENDFFWFNGDDVHFEDLLKYKQGGLHPVVLGDVLPKQSTCISDPSKKPRYRIVLKIGTGAFSLVWLAYDMLESRYVSMKIRTGSDCTHFSRETLILRDIQADKSKTRGHANIIQLYDSFVIKGPNGFHECLVTEVIVPLTDQFIATYCAPVILPQILEGFSYLHAHGTVHGDPHPGNFGLAIPHLDQYSEVELIENLGTPDAVPVVPRRQGFPMHTIPPYIVETVSLADFVRIKGFPADFEPRLKILDLGRAFRPDHDGAPALSGAVPQMFCAPEFMIELLQQQQDEGNKYETSGWSQEADIWALSCLLFNLFCRLELVRDWQPLESKLVQAVSLGGPPPREWANLSSRLKTWLETATFPAVQTNAWDLCYENLDKYECLLLQKADRDQLLPLIRYMIITDPKARLKIPQIMQHLHHSFSDGGSSRKGGIP